MATSLGTQIGNKYYTQSQISNPKYEDEIRQAVVAGGAIKNNMGNGKWEQQANGMNQPTQSQSSSSSYSQPSYNQISVYDPTDDINRMKEYQKQQAIAGLGKARDNSLSNLAADKEKIAPTYYKNREQTSTSSQLGAKNLAEFMASRGQTSAGAAGQSELNRVNQLQGDIGNWNTQEQGAFNENARSVTNTKNAYESDVASANAGIEANAMQQLIQAQQAYNAQQLAQANADRGFNYQAGRDTIGDTRYNQQYADQRGDVAYDRNYQSGRDYVNDTGKLANGQYTQAGQMNNINMQMQQAQLAELQNPNSTTNQMAKLGLDTAKLNYAALPAQLKAQAQQIAQQLSQGAIDIKTAQLKLNYLPTQIQQEIAQNNAQINATNRSNQGGGGSSSSSSAAAKADKANLVNASWAEFSNQTYNNNGENWLQQNASEIINTIGNTEYLKMLTQLNKLPVNQQQAYNDARKQHSLNYNQRPSD